MRMVIFHHNDADGRCAAAIMAYRYGPKGSGYAISCYEMDYKDAENPALVLDRVAPGDLVGVVDFSFKPQMMAKLVEKAAEVIWCDHHVTAKDYGYDDLPGVRDFSEKGLSGAECTWKFCFSDKVMPWGLTLLGGYDSWRHDQGLQTFEFYEGLKLLDTNPRSELWDRLLFEAVGDPGHYVCAIMEKGRAAILYRDNYCAGLRKSFGYETEIGGHRAYALNAYMFGSKGHGEKFTEYPVCIAYIHDGRKFTVSLYSETVDVSVIAKANGGGGHKGAAGFVCEKLPFERKP